MKDKKYYLSIIFVLAIFILFIIGCTEINSPKTNVQNYFPLEVGNSWTYCGSNDTTHKRIYTIKDITKIDNKNYFIYGLKGYNINDTIYKDNYERIWKLKNGNPVIWFDFTKDSGNTYSYPAFDTFIYIVTVQKYIVTNTYMNNFTDCVRLFFDIPNSVDDEVSYTFAPNIGIVKKYGAWSDDLLYSVSIHNRK